MPEIMRIIERKKDEMMSQITENNLYIRMIQDEFSHLKYKLDSIANEEKKSREAL